MLVLRRAARSGSFVLNQSERAATANEKRFSIVRNENEKDLVNFVENGNFASGFRTKGRKGGASSILHPTQRIGDAFNICELAYIKLFGTRAALFTGSEGERQEMENFHHRNEKFFVLVLFIFRGSRRNFKVSQQFLHHNSEFAGKKAKKKKKVEEEMETSCTMVVNSFVLGPERVNVELSLTQLWWRTRSKEIIVSLFTPSTAR